MLRRLLPLIVPLALLAAFPAAAEHQPIDVAIFIEGPQFVAPLQQMTYTVILNSVFPGAGYAVTQTLPPNVRFITAGAPKWTCLISGSKLQCGNERLDDFSTSFTVTVETPSRMQSLATSVNVIPLTNFDPDQTNNTAAMTTQMYDPAVCAPRHLEVVAPADRGRVAGPNVTLQWTPLPNATKYDVYATEGTSVLQLIATTNEPQVSHEFPLGEVQWYVEAAMSDCPAVTLAPMRFTVENLQPPAARRRAARH